MKIVILDGYALNPGDLSWKPVEELGEVVIYDRTEDDEIVERVGDAEVVLVNKIGMSRETMEKLPSLKYIGVTATGFDVIDLEAAKELGIRVTNVGGYSTDAVAQHVFALLLDITNRVSMHNEQVADGDWVKSKDFTFRSAPLVTLKGKTMGLLGYGDIGSQVSKIAQAFDMKVIAHRNSPEKHTDKNVALKSIEELFRESDVISLHAPMNDGTKEIVNKETLALMKDSAYLINTARGGLINEQDLADALKKNQIAAAGLDVLTSEPPKADNPLLELDNCVITPHIAWSFFASRELLIGLVAKNLKAFQNGEELNVIA